MIVSRFDGQQGENRGRVRGSAKNKDKRRKAFRRPKSKTLATTKRERSIQSNRGRLLDEGNGGLYPKDLGVLGQDVRMRHRTHLAQLRRNDCTGRLERSRHSNDLRRGETSSFRPGRSLRGRAIKEAFFRGHKGNESKRGGKKTGHNSKTMYGSGSGFSFLPKQVRTLRHVLLSTAAVL